MHIFPCTITCASLVLKLLPLGRGVSTTSLSPQLSVPVTVPKISYTYGLASSDPTVRHIGCLAMMAFYYLLWVGECTKLCTLMHEGKYTPVTRTKQFRSGERRCI